MKVERKIEWKLRYYIGYYRVILGFHELYWGYMGIMENKMETTI